MSAAGIKTNELNKTSDWTFLCSAFSYLRNGAPVKKDHGECSYSSYNEIVETRVVMNRNRRCEAYESTYRVSLTPQFLNSLERKYDQATTLANKDGNKTIVNDIQQAKQTHLDYIKSVRNSAVLRVTASHKPKGSLNAVCDVSLYARFRILDV